MDLDELFGNDLEEMLSSANLLVSKVNRDITEAKKASSDTSALLEYREEVLEFINDLVEGHVEDTEAFIIDMVVSLRERGLSEVSFSKFVRELEENGFEVNHELLINWLTTVNGVKEVIPAEDKIIFDTQIADRSKSDKEEEKDKKKIKKTATKVAKDNIKDDADVDVEI